MQASLRTPFSNRRFTRSSATRPSEAPFTASHPSINTSVTPLPSKNYAMVSYEREDVTAAEKLWAVPQLRRTIFELLGRKTSAKLMCLSRGSFETGLEVVWKKMDYEDYDKLRRLVHSIPRFDAYCNAVRTFPYTAGWATRDCSAPNPFLQHLRLFPNLRHIPINSTDTLDCIRLRDSPPVLLIRGSADWIMNASGTNIFVLPVVSQDLTAGPWKKRYILDVNLDLTDRDMSLQDQEKALQEARKDRTLFRHPIRRLTCNQPIDLRLWTTFFESPNIKWSSNPILPINGPSELQLTTTHLDCPTLQNLVSCFNVKATRRSSLRSLQISTSPDKGLSETSMSFTDLLRAPTTFWSHFRGIKHVTLPIPNRKTHDDPLASQPEPPLNVSLRLHSMTLILYFPPGPMDLASVKVPPMSIACPRLLKIGGPHCHFELKVSDDDCHNRLAVSRFLTAMMDEEMKVARKRLLAEHGGWDW